MKLKNWAYVLFEHCHALHHMGFVDVRPTPSIEIEGKTLSPDIIAWSQPVTLIIEAKSGSPDPDGDVDQAKDYLEIPKEILEKYLGQPVHEREAVILYSEDNLRDPTPRESLLSKIALERRIIIWSLNKRAGEVHLFYGNHSNQDLNKLLNARLPVALIPPPRIFLQPDSPIVLLTREIFIRLYQRAYRLRTKKFSFEDARVELIGQVFGFDEREEQAKIRKAFTVGNRHELCRQIASDEWELNLVFSNPERYFEKITRLLQQSRVDDYF